MVSWTQAMASLLEPPMNGSYRARVADLLGISCEVPTGHPFRRVLRESIELGKGSEELGEPRQKNHEFGLVY